MIRFNTVRWQNLLSTGNALTEVRLDRERTTLIIGSNGSGKSTILDAIMFVLYNKPFRKVVKGLLINSVTGKNLLVEIEFERGGSKWLVRRGSKPSVFEIHRDGDLIDQTAENKDYQSFLENTVLGMNQKAFTQIVILGAASFVPFMQLTVPVRREVIEDFMDIQIFSDMNVLLKNRVVENKKALDAATARVALVQARLEQAEAMNASLLKDNQGLIDKKNQAIDALAIVASGLIDRVAEEEEAIKALDIGGDREPMLTRAKRELEHDMIRYEQDMKTHEKAHTFLSAHDDCPTCHQKIDHEFKLAELRNHENKGFALNDVIRDLKRQIAEIDVEMNYIFEEKKKRQKHQAEIDRCNREIEDCQRQVERLMGEIEKLSVKKDIIDFEPLRTEMAEKQAIRDEVAETTRIYTAAVGFLKDDGIKSVIIRQYIPVVNTIINRYLSEMDFFVDFQINEAFEETIKSRHRDEFSYESFSEGEKMRIDLAILFAWREVAKLRNSTATNLLIFDEVLDSSLDPNGVEEFIRIIKSMTSDENIFVISHRGDTIGDKFDEVLKFSRVKGFSHMEVV